MKKIYLLLILSIYLIACQPIQQKLIGGTSESWKYSDLRLLDPVDALTPEQDLIALYTRVNDRSFQIRLDFLDLISPSSQDIYIAMDTNPGGLDQIATINDGSLEVKINWDYLISIPASGDVKVINSHQDPVDGMGLLIIRDSFQDAIVLSFNQKTLPINWNLTKLQVIVTLPNRQVAVDQIGPISIDAPSPSKVRVLFVFWNTFSSTTPAETLRSWAGAHSGPMSSRHGLKYLLDDAARTKSTIFLLDLLEPETMSALDYLNVLPRIRDLVNQGVIALPGNVLLSEIIPNGLNKDGRLNLNVGEIWNIKKNINSVMLNNVFDLYLYRRDKNSEYKNNILVGDYDYAQLFNGNNNCILSLSDEAEVLQLPALLYGCKAQLLLSAISSSPAPVIIGGDFATSLLGDPAISSALFTYIYNHPWIHIETITDMKTDLYPLPISPPPHIGNHADTSNNTSPESALKISPSNAQIDHPIYAALLEAPRNQFTDLAWQIFTSLTQPSSADFDTLGVNYLGQLGFILAAANWVDQPTSTATCSFDLDYDGKKECILSTQKIFLTLEPEGGYVPFVFTRDAHGNHQIIGPTWEFILGISDPSVWNPALGVQGDPDQVLGAFFDGFRDWQMYKFEVIENSISIESSVLAMRKSFSISDNTIHVDVQAPSASDKITQIPLVIDPWMRFASSWDDQYTFTQTSAGYQWGLNSINLVEIRTNAHSIFYPFNLSHDSLAYPEDPNFDYSRGHYLPYPMALAEIHSFGNYSVDIIINP